MPHEREELPVGLESRTPHFVEWLAHLVPDHDECPGTVLRRERDDFPIGAEYRLAHPVDPVAFLVPHHEEPRVSRCRVRDPPTVGTRATPTWRRCATTGAGTEWSLGRRRASAGDPATDPKRQRRILNPWSDRRRPCRCLLRSLHLHSFLLLLVHALQLLHVAALDRLVAGAQV